MSPEPLDLCSQGMEKSVVALPPCSVQNQSVAYTMIVHSGVINLLPHLIPTVIITLFGHINPAYTTP